MSRGYRDGDSRRYFDWLYYANLDLLAAKISNATKGATTEPRFTVSNA